MVCLSLTGCSREWRKKFIRRHRKETAAPQAILTLDPDFKAMYPPADRYREHYAFWKSWQDELLNSLGQIRKRDLRYLDSAIGEVRALQTLLTGRSADRLREILIQLSGLHDKWESKPDTWQMPVSDRTRLEKIQREIAKDFQYGDVKESIAKDPGTP